MRRKIEVLLVAVGVSTLAVFLTFSIAHALVNYSNEHEAETTWGSPYYRWDFQVFAYYYDHTTSSATLSETSTWTQLLEDGEQSTRDFWAKNEVRDGNDSQAFGPNSKKVTITEGGQAANAAWDYDPDLVVQKYSGAIRNINVSYSQTIGYDSDTLDLRWVNDGDTPVVCYLEGLGVFTDSLDLYSQDTCP